ncbi:MULTISPECIES: type II 3-dehydroquinate dehydratase [unclassified Janibacter]|uniref:type II 3-dehydroquinate dehydratase n=1 Tax=unclassified Janibacter TaxID=2649294 RepID=UPI003D00F83E
MPQQPVIAILNGPNLNLLGEREPEVYGHDTLADVERRCRARADELGLAVDFRQTNHEGVMIDAIHELRSSAAGFVVNAAGWTHTSVAIRDALAAVRGPIVEVHLSDIHAREEFRHFSYISDLAVEVIVGRGVTGYEDALTLLAEPREDGDRGAFSTP